MIDFLRTASVRTASLPVTASVLLALTFCSCDALRVYDGGARKGDPAQAPVVLNGAAEDWEATLVHDAGVGVWCVKSFDIFPQYATPELVACDDLGRLWVAISYSGKWTPREEIHDGTWLGGLDHGDIDPRVDGTEIYAGSQRGSLYQVRAYPEGTLDGRRIAHFPGEEIHTIVALDLDADATNSVPGGELLVFTGIGTVYLVSPNGPMGGFTSAEVMTLPGRVRDAVLLPPTESSSQIRIAVVSRDGRLGLMTQAPDGTVTVEVILEEAMGLGRIALAPKAEGQPQVLYATLDDGRILRIEEGEGGWAPETIYNGPLGPRGIAVGQFVAQAGAETLAIFGYSGEVELLTRGVEGWISEVIFDALDKGHWVTAAELDGRNSTDELVVCGYSGRIVQLARPVGYGL